MSGLYSRLNKTEKIHNLNFATLEPNTILQHQSENIFAAKLAGKSFGRPGINPPLNFSEIITDWQNGKIAAVEAMKKLGMKKTTFYKAIKGLE